MENPFEGASLPQVGFKQCLTLLRGRWYFASRGESLKLKPRRYLKLPEAIKAHLARVGAAKPTGVSRIAIGLLIAIKTDSSSKTIF